DLSSRRGGGATTGEARLGRSTVAVVVEARLGQTKGAIGDLSAFDCKAYEEDEEVQQRLHRRIEELRFGQNTQPLLIKNRLGRRGRRRRVRRQIETEEMLSLPISPLGRSRLVVCGIRLSPRSSSWLERMVTRVTGL
ncbi:hypothetical protein B296_00003477, partial [Ensete ventricosum]